MKYFAVCNLRVIRSIEMIQYRFGPVAVDTVEGTGACVLLALRGLHIDASPTGLSDQPFCLPGQPSPQPFPLGIWINGDPVDVKTALSTGDRAIADISDKTTTVFRQNEPVPAGITAGTMKSQPMS